MNRRVEEERRNEARQGRGLLTHRTAYRSVISLIPSVMSIKCSLFILRILIFLRLYCVPFFTQSLSPSALFLCHIICANICYYENCGMALKNLNDCWDIIYIYIYIDIPSKWYTTKIYLVFGPVSTGHIISFVIVNIFCPYANTMLCSAVSAKSIIVH